MTGSEAAMTAVVTAFTWGIAVGLAFVVVVVLAARSGRG